MQLLVLFLLFQLLPQQDVSQETVTKAVTVPLSTQRLLSAIASYEQLAENDTWWTLPDTTTLLLGNKAAFVPVLQQKLLQLQDLSQKDTSTGTVYTNALAAAVKQFQRRHGLKPDGLLGPRTIKALNVSPAARLHQLRQNLRRLDSLALLPASYVFINIPDYTLQLVDSNRVVLKMKVIVGKPGFQTFPFESELNMLVLRPKWHLPTSISVNEILPILKRNPAYLARKNMQLTYSTADGTNRTINPWRVNWKKINRENFTFRIIQQPGPHNELGQVKFLFRNNIAQYLHDTPDKELFKQQNRALSHGCIRLEKPQELADFLLTKRTGYTSEKLDRLRSNYKPDHYILIKQPMPLFIVYHTAWVDEQQQVHFRDDIYQYDLLSRSPGK